MFCYDVTEHLGSENSRGDETTARINIEITITKILKVTSIG